MQVRFLSLLAATVTLSATAVAFAQNVQSQGDPEPLVPIYMEYEGVKGESSPPPPPPPPPQAPPAEQGVQAHPQAGLLVPAVQKMQDPPQEGRPQMDGVVLLNSAQASAGGAERAHDVFVTEAAASEGQTRYVGSANGGVWKTTDAAGAAPSDITTAPAESDSLQYNFSGIEGAAAQEPEASAQQVEQAQRPRRNFSISIGGVTVGAGGVSVAVGDVDGDGRSSRNASRRQPARPSR